jgi:hypothetical protein
MPRKEPKRERKTSREKGMESEVPSAAIEKVVTIYVEDFTCERSFPCSLQLKHYRIAVRKLKGPSDQIRSA